MASWCAWKAEENGDVGEGGGLGLAPGGTRVVRYSERREEIAVRVCIVVQREEEAVSSRTRI